MSDDNVPTNTNNPSEKPEQSPAVPPKDTTVTPVISLPMTTPQNAPSKPSLPNQRRRYGIIGGLVLLLLACLYLFLVYLPNTPSHIYGASLVDSGKAVD